MTLGNSGRRLFLQSNVFRPLRYTSDDSEGFYEEEYETFVAVELVVYL